MTLQEQSTSLQDPRYSPIGANTGQKACAGTAPARCRLLAAALTSSLTVRLVLQRTANLSPCIHGCC